LGNRGRLVSIKSSNQQDAGSVQQEVAVAWFMRLTNYLASQQDPDVSAYHRVRVRQITFLESLKQQTSFQISSPVGFSTSNVA
jgi:hypothetical protein